MPKKILVTEKGLIQLIKTMFSSKLKGTEQTTYDKLVKMNPEIGKAWDNLDSEIRKSLKTSYRIKKNNGLDTTAEEEFSKKWNMPLE